MQVIIEGPDGSGKTALFRAMQQDYRLMGMGLRFIDVPRPSPTVLANIKEIELRELMLYLSCYEGHRTYVWDRFTITTHEVYRRIWPERENPELKPLVARIDWSETHLVLLDAPLLILRTRLGDRGEIDEVKENIEEMKLLYRSLPEMIPKVARVLRPQWGASTTTIIGKILEVL